MKTLSVALAAHYQLGMATLATCWKVTLTDGTILGYTDNAEDLTDNAEDLVISGLTYDASLGYNASAVQTTGGTDVDNLELLGVLDPAAVDASGVAAGRWDFAAIEVFRVNYLDLTMGTDPLRKGTLGEIKHGKSQWTADLMGMTQRLTQRIGRIVMPTCDVELGDPATCKIDLTTFPRGIVTGTITTVTSRRVFNVAALTDADGWYENGSILFTSGANTGIRQEVKTSFANGAIELQEAFPYAVIAGDAVSAKVGCLKRLVEDCRAKFDNEENHHGFVLVPGQDQLSQIAQHTDAPNLGVGTGFSHVIGEVI